MFCVSGKNKTVVWYFLLENVCYVDHMVYESDSSNI